MSVIKPRNRLVNFRLSEEEFEAMHVACAKSGARSLSDFARGAVLRAMQDAERGMQVGGEVGASTLARIEAMLSALEARVGGTPSTVPSNSSQPVREPAH